MKDEAPEVEVTTFDVRALDGSTGQGGGVGGCAVKTPDLDL